MTTEQKTNLRLEPRKADGDEEKTTVSREPSQGRRDTGGLALWMSQSPVA
jgi:hypothetical protein